MARHLLQQADLPTGAQVKPIAGTALGLLAQQVAGAASPERSSSNKPACTTALNSGTATQAINTDQFAGQAVALSQNAVVTEILGPKKIFAQGIASGKRQVRACAGATITQTVNGVTATTRPAFRTGPDDALIEDATVTATGKTAVQNTQALVVNGTGNYGVAFIAQSTGPISSAAIDKYITRAASRAAH